MVSKIHIDKKIVLADKAGEKLANPDDKTPNITQLSKQESTMKIIQKVKHKQFSQLQIEIPFKLQEEKKTGIPIFQYGERYGPRMLISINYSTFHAAKSHLFSTSLPMFLAVEERLGNGKIVLPLTLMWLLSGASLCQNGQKREFFGQLPIFTED